MRRRRDIRAEGSTRSSSRTPCIPWRAICTRCLCRRHAQALPDQDLVAEDSRAAADFPGEDLGGAGGVRGNCARLKRTGADVQKWRYWGIRERATRQIKDPPVKICCWLSSRSPGGRKIGFAENRQAPPLTCRRRAAGLPAAPKDYWLVIVAMLPSSRVMLTVNFS